MANLELRKVNKSFDKTHVIKDVDLKIEDGEFIVFVGPSGCGKSTLLRLISGLESVTTGEMHIGDNEVSKLSPSERGIAMVFQSYALYPHMTVYKNMSFGLENVNTPKAEIHQRVMKAADMLGLSEYLDRKPKALSGGQRQRVAIGRSIVRDPSLFLFDEPLSNLDAKLRVQTRGEISSLHKRLGTTMIYVTHDQVEAMTMADRIVVLRDGRVEQFGTPLELFNCPENKFVADFIGSPRMNMYKVFVREANESGVTVSTPDGESITLPFNGLSVEQGQDLTLGIRPTHIEVVEQGGVEFKISRSEMMGHETILYGQVSGSDEETIVHLPNHKDVKAGETIRIGFPESYCHLFDNHTDKAIERLTIH